MGPVGEFPLDLRRALFALHRRTAPARHRIPARFSDPVKSGITTNNGFATATTFSNVFAVQRNDYNKRTAENLSLGWNNDFKIADNLHFNVDASWSRADRTDFLLETNTGTGFARAASPIA